MFGGAAFRNGYLKALLLCLATWLAGCSGSGSTSNTPTDDSLSTPEQPAPPADDPIDPAAQPSVSFSAAEQVVDAGESAMLTWSSTNATGCSASGGWSGSRATRGSATVGPLSQSTTFTLTCTGGAGNAVAMLSVSVMGNVVLDWQPPTENVDGSPLNDLAGYRIYYGQQSGSYTDELAVQGATLTQYQVALPSGSYYFAMTALDAQGNESSHSNEVLKVVN